MAGRATGPKEWATCVRSPRKSALSLGIVRQARFLGVRREAAGSIEVETVWHKSGAALEKRLGSLEPTICLDPRGAPCDSSEAFARMLFDKLDAGGSRLYFGIGPAEGFTDALRANTDLLSLSTLTFPHQMARLVLLEQIYRAAEIRRGSGYHK
eukprot:CAMPEP_0197407368 /NCGR_PEP_ID=MMETSP1165-20131217/27000_1 /TAXON_ID=284809 /ORGANISM="Chrysocystis fragilis, Strain CCMP3189" /LENGTH=153 /DNA_ID=CAMNT_0042933749 /DNA_START=51 /DNA_END=513 /DNA_ORIENTATION=-